MTQLRTASLALALALSLVAACAVADDPDTLGASSAEAGVRSSFDLWQSADGYHFHLVAGNGAILLTSEGYDSRTGALTGILSVLDNGGLATHYRVTTGADQKAYVSLLAGNHRVIATSEGYAQTSNARRAIDSDIAAVASYLEYWASATGARFDVFPGQNGKYFFDLHARNGAIVLQSQSYSTEAAALNGAFAVAEYGTDLASYQVRTATTGFYFTVEAPNHQIIATSQVYSTRASALRGRDAIIALLPEVELL